jgi:hypothetical protein
MANERKIVGALGLGGRVYRAGMENELATDAAAAKVDLSGHIGEGLALSGDWGSAASAKATKSPLDGVSFGSEAAGEAAASAGLTPADFEGVTATGQEGYTKPDVAKIIAAKEAK